MKYSRPSTRMTGRKVIKAEASVLFALRGRDVEAFLRRSSFCTSSFWR